MDSTNAIVIFITTPNREDAQSLARVLVEQRLAACVQILPEIVSIYRWQNQVQQETEVLLLIKTVREKFAALETVVRANHAYEVPEILAVPAAEISQPYLKWLIENIAD